MKKIILFLSGVWEPKLVELIGKDDLVLCSPNADLKNKKINHIVLPKTLNDKYGREASDWLIDINARGNDSAVNSVIECFLNDFYSYSLKPLVAILVSLKEYLNKTGFSEVLVLSVKPSSKIIPMVGFQTSESLRGSKDLLYTRLIEILPLVFPNIRFKYWHLKGDFFSFEPFRVFSLRIINFALYVRMILILIHYRLKNLKGNLDETRKSIILVRTEHQLRFAKRIFGSSPYESVVFLPQVSQGTLSSMYKMSNSVIKSVHQCNITIRMLLKALLRTRKEIKHLKSKAHYDVESLYICGLYIPINHQDIANEIRLISVVLFYKNILAELLSGHHINYLVNFELVGRMAGLEALAAHESNVKVISIQTALISSIPHPVFPYSDFFFTDSEFTNEMLQSIGSYKKGEVVFKGPPYPVKPFDVNKFLVDIHFVFFTQPHEYDETYKILFTLCDWCKVNNKRLTIRLHPRDKIEKYERIQSLFRELVEFDISSDLIGILMKRCICVTRTSSVAKEALAFGIPILLCLFSKSDRQTKADYIVRDTVLQYCATTEDELLALLNNPIIYMDSSKVLNERLFSGKSLITLKQGIYR